MSVEQRDAMWGVPCLEGCILTGEEERRDRHNYALRVLRLPHSVAHWIPFSEVICPAKYEVIPIRGMMQSDLLCLLGFTRHWRHTNLYEMSVRRRVFFPIYLVSCIYIIASLLLWSLSWSQMKTKKTRACSVVLRALKVPSFDLQAPCVLYIG